MSKYEDPIILAPTMLSEGKAIGTARRADLVLLNHLHHAKHIDEVPDARKIGQTVGRRKLIEVQSRVRQKLGKLVTYYLNGDIPEKELRFNSMNLMRQAWSDVFLAGLRGGGIVGTGSGGNKPMVQLGEGDDKWLNGAIKHEAGFLKGFLDDLVAGKYSMDPIRRAGMYADSLSSFYESARVIGMPAASLIHWVGPDDNRTCAGCRYLFEHSPYTKFILPCSPRSGACSCLVRCRDRLFIRLATTDEALAVLSGHKYSRGQHVANLEKLKSQGHL